MQGISRIALIAALATAAVAGGARAQEAEEKVTFLGTITLSALRTAAEIGRTGVSVSVVEADELNRDGSIRLADYLSQLPGVSVATQGPFGGLTTVRLRGFDGRYIAVFVDGIRIDDPSGTSVSTDFGALMTGDIARIEVLRGSQSALWGGSAVGGVINISTRAGIEEGFHQTVSVEGGSYGTARLSYGLTQKTDKLELSLNATHFRTDGFSSFDGGTEDDGAEASRLSFSGRYQVSDTLAIGAAAFVQRTRNDFDGYIDTDSDGFTDTFTDQDNVQTRRDQGARVFAEIDLGTTRHDLDLSFSRSKRDLDEEGTVSQFTGERLRFSWQGTTEFSEALTFVYGADWTQETARTTALPGGSADTDDAGIWGQVAWSPSDNFDLIATARVDDHSSFGTFTTGRLSMAWRPNDAVTLRGSIARGFRAPSLDELYGDYPAFFFTGNPNLQPETSLSYELGADYAFAGGASVSATLFQLEVEDRIAADPATFWSTLGNLPGTSVGKGIEISGDAPLTDRLGLSFAYTYTDGRNPDGSRFFSVPRHELALALDADLSDRLSARVSVRYLGDRIDRDVNTFSAVEMPDVALVGVGFGYDLTEAVNATLRIENLFDEDYQSAHGYGAAGRSVYVGLQAKF